MRVITNRRGGTCAHCGRRVAAGAGSAFVLERGDRWRVCCKSAACARALGILSEGETAAAAPQARALSAGGVVSMPFDRDALPLLRAMPGARWNPEDKRWEVSTDPVDRPRLLELADRLGLDVAPELRRVERDPAVVALVDSAREVGAYDFQLAGIEFLAQRERALLGDDMGLGKTLQVLRALPERARCLVVCPASLKFNWRDETARWRPDLKPVVLKGRGSFRLPDPGEVVITNFELLPARPKKPKGAKTAPPSPWDLTGVALVCDEATALKNYRAARSQNFQALAQTAAHVWLLSGTPLMNRPQDLYGILSAGLMEREVFGGWGGFCRCFHGRKNRWGGWEFGAPREDTPERLRRVTLRRHKAEVLSDLPTLRYRDLAVNSLEGIQEDLDEAWSEWAGHEGYGADLDGFEPEALPPFSAFSRIRAKLAESRIAALLELVASYEEADEPLVVFSAHRAPIDTLAEREGWAAITGDTGAEERRDIVHAFQAGELRGVALTIRAGGYGLTLTRASNMIFVDQDWTPAMNLQAVDRCRRIGQTADSILVTRMLSDHPLDQHVLRLIARKVAIIERAVDTTAAYVAQPAAAGPQFEEESDEALAARLAAIEAAAAEADRNATLDRVDRKLGALRGNGAPDPPDITPELANSLQSAWSYMLRVCDGAVMKDGAGFNKPDAAVAHWAMPVIDDERTQALAWLMLRKYRGQLGDEFPELYPDTEDS